MNAENHLFPAPQPPQALGPHGTSPDWAAIWQGLDAEVRLGAMRHAVRATADADGWLVDASERLAYGYDNSRRHAMPDAVALPRTRDDVVAIVHACRAHRVPIVARGRGTNTTGATVPGEDALVVSFERMDRVLAIRPGDRVVTSGDGEVFPAGLLVGQVALGTDKRLRVVLAADYQRLEFLRVLRSHELAPLTDPGSLVAPPLAPEVIGPQPPEAEVDAEQAEGDNG